MCENTTKSRAEDASGMNPCCAVEAAMVAEVAATRAEATRQELKATIARGVMNKALRELLLCSPERHPHRWWACLARLENITGYSAPVVAQINALAALMRLRTNCDRTSLPCLRAAITTAMECGIPRRAPLLVASRKLVAKLQCSLAAKESASREANIRAQKEQMAVRKLEAWWASVQAERVQQAAMEAAEASTRAVMKELKAKVKVVILSLCENFRPSFALTPKQKTLFEGKCSRQMQSHQMLGCFSKRRSEWRRKTMAMLRTVLRTVLGAALHHTIPSQLPSASRSSSPRTSPSASLSSSPSTCASAVTMNKLVDAPSATIHTLDTDVDSTAPSTAPIDARDEAERKAQRAAAEAEGKVQIGLHKIFVTALGSKRLKQCIIHIRLDDSVQHLKEAIAEEEGIPWDQQRLLFGTRQLNDNDRSISDYSIGDEATVTLLLRLRGGDPVGWDTLLEEVLRRARIPEAMVASATTVLREDAGATTVREISAVMESEVVVNQLSRALISEGLPPVFARSILAIISAAIAEAGESRLQTRSRPVGTRSTPERKKDNSTKRARRNSGGTSSGGSVGSCAGGGRSTHTGAVPAVVRTQMPIDFGMNDPDNSDNEDHALVYPSAAGAANGTCALEQHDLDMAARTVVQHWRKSMHQEEVMGWHESRTALENELRLPMKFLKDDKTRCWKAMQATQVRSMSGSASCGGSSAPTLPACSSSSSKFDNDPNTYDDSMDVDVTNAMAAMAVVPRDSLNAALFAISRGAHRSLHRHQRDVVDAVLRGEDVLTTIACGGGKTFAVLVAAKKLWEREALAPSAAVASSLSQSALASSSEPSRRAPHARSIVVFIVPRKTLQHELHRAVNAAGISVAILGEDQRDYSVISAAEAGEYNVVIITDKRTLSFLRALREKRTRVAMFVFDEIHAAAMSIYPEYGPAIRACSEYDNASARIVLMTATLTPIQTESIVLMLSAARQAALRRLHYSAARQNLQMHILSKPSARAAKVNMEVVRAIGRAMNALPQGGVTMVFVNTHNEAIDLAEKLREQLQKFAGGVMSTERHDDVGVIIGGKRKGTSYKVK